jgi:hypothetical protein
MGTQLFRLLFILLFCSIITNNHLNTDREKIILNSLFTHASYPTINFALKQIESLPLDIELELHSTEDAIPVCVNIRIFIFIFLSSSVM